MENERVEIRSRALSLSCRRDGSGLTLGDVRRGVRWELDEEAGGADPARVERVGEGCLLQVVAVEGRRVRRQWRLVGDDLVVETAAEDPGEFVAAALPGPFHPASGGLEVALPVMQGLRFSRGSEPFRQHLRYGGHASVSMAMLGYMTDGGCLVASPEDAADWRVVAGARADGTPYAHFEAMASLGTFAHPRCVRLRTTEPGVTAACKAYRRMVQARGAWKGWDEKLAEKPGLDRLFGALMAFIGYNAGPFDYVAECRKLKARGFDRAFVYPVRFNTPSRGFRMGGDAPIHLDDETIAAILAQGYDVGPWTWVVEALDDGSPAIRRTFRQAAGGGRVAGWKMDDYQWYRCCTPFQTGFVKAAYEGPMRSMTWAHFDVNATMGPQECVAADHPAHAGRALDRRGDLAFLKELLGAATNGGRVVSSEGFVDSLAACYDIGTTKLLPSWGGTPFWTVPMTALVYHDSMVHDWWELHNYNASGGFDNRNRFGRWAGGRPRQKAAMDALGGWPPNVFPFGKQYRWVDIRTRKTESYTVRFEDAPVQEALAAALPVTRLHRRIGKVEMLSHRFVTDDGSVQESVFADGTRVVANFGDQAFRDGAVRLEPLAWVAGRE